MMLMAWGPFRFTVPNYSVETIRRSIQPRVEAQPVIGALPPVHRLGPGNETITLDSTFHPHHLNGRGLSQLTAVRQAVNSLTPLMLTHVNGTIPNVFGLWVATGIDDEQTLFGPGGVAQTITTTLSLMQYGGVSVARSIALQVAAGSVGFGVNAAAGMGIGASISAGVSFSSGISTGVSIGAEVSAGDSLSAGVRLGF